MLVVSQSYYPGWRARVDGFDSPVVPTDVALCGVWVPSGVHTVDLAYRPRTFYQGATVSVMSLLLLGLLTARRRESS